MFAAYNNPASVYGRVAVETGIAAARPVELVIMLHEGAVETLTRAAAQMRSRETAAKNESITRAIRIIDEGLKATLDVRGGTLVATLDELYAYMIRRLLTANLKNDPAMLDEVRTLLLELKGAWDQIADRPAKAP